MHEFPDSRADELAELRAHRDRERRHIRTLMAHPDCRDPDHPGCEACRAADDPQPPEVCWGCDDLDKFGSEYHCSGFGTDLAVINGTPLPCRACRHQYKEAA